MATSRAPLNSRERHEVLERALGNTHFFSPELPDCDIRPLVRFSIWNLLSLATTPEPDPLRISVRKGLSVMKQAATPLTSRFSALQDIEIGSLRPARRQDLLSAQSLFITPQSHQHVLARFQIDRTFSPVGRRLPHSSVHVTTQGLAGIAAKVTAKSWARTADFSATSRQIASSVAPRLEGFVSIEQLSARLLRDLHAFATGMATGSHFLQVMPNIHQAFTAGWYQPITMGVLNRFNDSEITTIDVQHGQQGPYQSMYVGLPRSDTPRESVAPTEFWVWGDKTQARMGSSEGHEATITGYPFLFDTDIYRAALDPHLQIPDIDILVSLHAPHVDSPDEVPYEIIEILAETGLSVHLRQHPNHNLSGAARDRLVRRFGDLVKVDTPRLPFSVVLPGARLNVSGFSSTTLEAAALGVPTILWSPIAQDQFGDLISSGLVSSTFSSQSVAEYLSNTVQIDSNAVSRYLVMSDESLSRRINEFS